MPQDDDGGARPDFPSELPEGVTIADLPDEDIRLRARFVAQMFDHLTPILRDFVAAGCPLEERELVMRQVTNGIELSETTFRGAAEWRESREEAVKQGFVEFRASMAKGLEEVPAVLTAALLCDAALGAKEEFLELVRESAPALRELEARAAAQEAAEPADRSRLH